MKLTNTDSNNKKPMWFTVFIIAMSVIVFIIAASVIYSTFFEKEINKEKNRQNAEKYMTETLESNEKEAKIYRKQNEDIIKKYNIDIYGKYTCTYNETDKNTEDQDEYNSYTVETTKVMEIKEDSTAVFDDGTTGWWMLKETDDGIVHMGLVLPEDKTPQIYLVCGNSLIDENKACFIGEVPDKKTFDATFTAGNLTLEFSKDGTIDGEYTEIVKEDGTEYPYTEAYSGKYERNGQFLDIVLNTAEARYFIFENKISKKPISGFASRYYIKN